MPLSGTVLANKDASPQSYQPLLLAVFQFVDGSFARYSTNPLNVAEGGYQFGGHDYQARIAQQDIQAVQARSEQGIDRFPSVTLHLNNANQTLWGIEKTIGFKGATLTLSLVLFDIDATTGAYVFSSDAPTRFTGICDAPSLDDGCATLTVTATANHNLAKVFFPILHVQNRCINLFPINAQRRLAGSSDMGAWEWGCGYNPDQAATDPEIGGDARRGNTTTANLSNPNGTPLTDSGGCYVSCDYTKESCVARGMYSVDSTNRATGRFTGEQFAPIQRETQSKAYVEGKNVTVRSVQNQSIYNESYPMLYGSQWTKPLIVNVLGDGNSTRMECVICVGDIGPNGVIQVVVNGVIVPKNNGPGSTDPLFRWNYVGDPALGTHIGGGGGTPATTYATGSRNGAATKDAGYNDSGGVPQGDPHGSCATIEIVVYRELADSSAIPNVDIWADGPKVKLATTTDPADQASWPYIYSNNPVWILLDLLIWANYRYNEIDLASFQTAATVCDVSVDYIDLNGETASHRRFMCEFFLRQRQAAAQVIPQVLQCCNGQLVPNSDTGLLQILIRQTLADQQPAPVPGSNYSTAVRSFAADFNVASPAYVNGYVAYLFDETTILRDGPDGPPKIRPYSTANSDTPNTIGFAFQDADNQYQQDSISISDADGVNRAGGYQGGQQVAESFQELGISNFDQASRIGNTNLAERLRGNEGLPAAGGSDTRGSRYFELEESSRVEHLRVGQICLLRYQQLGLQPQTQLQSPGGTPITGILVRVLKIQPRTNYETAVVTLQWHEDFWYTDLYGQRPATLYSNPLNNRPVRPPYPWKPFGDQPQASDAMFDRSDWSFQVGEFYGLSAQGSAIAQIAVGGCQPVNTLSTTARPPLFDQYQGTTAPTGGTIADGLTLLIAIAVKDSSGLWSALSKLCSVTIPTGGAGTNTAVTPDINWQAGSSGYAVFAGRDEQSLCWQDDTAHGVGTPGTITLSALNVATYGPPDILFDHLAIRVKKIIHAGVWGAAASAVGSGTLKFEGAAFGVNQWAGYDISLLAWPIADSAPVPRFSFRVSSNTADTLSVTPNPATAGMLAGCVFVMRAKPDTITATTIGDSNFDNFYGPGGLMASTEGGKTRLRIIGGTGRGTLRNVIDNSTTGFTIDRPWDVTPDSTTRFIIEEAAWQDTPPIEQSISSVFAPSPVPAIATPIVDNYQGQTLLVQCETADAQGGLGLKRYAPLREIYIWGSQGTRTITTSTTMLVTDGNVLCDTTSGAIVFTLLPADQIGNQLLIVQKVSADANTVAITCDGADTFPDGSTVITLIDHTSINVSMLKFNA